MNPKNIEGILRYLQTGDAATIPAGVTFDELRAAAKRIGGVGSVARFKGLAELRAALADTLKGRDVLEYIEAAANPFARRAFYVADDQERPEWPESELLRRLGFSILCIDVVCTRAAQA